MSLPNHCENLQDYLHGDIGADERTSFEGHLANCPACDEEVRASQQIDDLIRDAWSNFGAPTSVLGSARNQPSVSKEKSRRIPVSALASIAAAVALVASLIFFLQSPNDSNPGPGTTGNNPDAVANQEALANEPLVTFHQTGAEGDAILIPTTKQHSKFTIVRAYRPIAKQQKINIQN